MLTLVTRTTMEQLNVYSLRELMRTKLAQKTALQTALPSCENMKMGIINIQRKVAFVITNKREPKVHFLNDDSDSPANATAAVAANYCERFRTCVDDDSGVF
jgi:predicted RNA-binding Zn ribbon-like protein